MDAPRENPPELSWFTPWHWPKWILAILACVWLIVFGISLVPVKVAKVILGATPDQDTIEFIERWPAWGYERPAKLPVIIVPPQETIE